MIDMYFNITIAPENPLTFEQVAKNIHFQF